MTKNGITNLCISKKYIYILSANDWEGVASKKCMRYEILNRH